MMHFLTSGNMLDENGNIDKNVIRIEKEIIKFINNTAMKYSKQDKLP